MPDLFSCFDDMNTCCFVYWCYLCAVGRTHERAGLKSGPAWKLPTLCCCGAVLYSCCLLGIPLHLLAMYWIVEGRDESQKHCTQALVMTYVMPATWPPLPPDGQQRIAGLAGELRAWFTAPTFNITTSGLSRLLVPLIHHGLRSRPN